MKKLTKKVEKEIQKFVEDNQPQMDWNGLDLHQDVRDILEKGWDDWLMELYEYNLEYICEIESSMVQHIQEQWDGYDPDEVAEFSREYISVDINKKNLLSNVTDVTMMAYVYSNYDCCNSMDEMEPEGYLGEVFERVKAGVAKEDYLYEFSNGAYGGSLFCFIFKTDIRDALELLEQIKTAKTVRIPKGTQFGFFSSFSGAGSVFEKTTFQDMVLPVIGETEYDTIGLTADVCQSYNLRDVYGDDSFVDAGTVILD